MKISNKLKALDSLKVLDDFDIQIKVYEKTIRFFYFDDLDEKKDWIVKMIAKELGLKFYAQGYNLQDGIRGLCFDL